MKLGLILLLLLPVYGQSDHYSPARAQQCAGVVPIPLTCGSSYVGSTIGVCGEKWK